MDLGGFKRAGHPPSLVAAFLHFDVSFMCWVMLGALGVAISESFGLSASEKGLMVAVPLLAGSAFRLIVGPLADRYGPRRVGICSLTLTTLPLLWGWLAMTTYSQALGVGVLLGVAGASFAVSLPLASRWYPREHQGLAMGIAGAGNSGTIIAALCAPCLAEQHQPAPQGHARGRRARPRQAGRRLRASTCRCSRGRRRSSRRCAAPMTAGATSIASR